MVSARKGPVGNLPARLDEFVGRNLELGDVRHAMESSRLVTLVGPGGVGKTRLALQVAADLQRAFPHGVWFVDVAPLQDPELLASTVASVLELPTGSSRWAPGLLGRQLADRAMLLVLDNCEHLSEACAELVDTLLKAASHLKMLVTSRQPLGVKGEHIRSVQPLRVPAAGDENLDELARCDAVRLFLERATAVEPGFALTADNAAAVAGLCRRLDGLPLALELAAARIRHLSPQQILSRLDGRFQLLRTDSALAAPRQRSLHSLIGWSYDLCTPAERELWSRLTVFSGSFSAPAAEAICAGTIVAREDVLDLLARLVDRSIVVTVRQSSEVRYRMLETIRAFGQERIAASGDEENLRRRHRDYFRDRLVERYPHWFGPGQYDTMAWVRAERDNLRAAIDFCLGEPTDARAAAVIASGLGGETLLTGRLGEGRLWIDRVLAVLDEDCTERAILLWISGQCAGNQGDFESAERLLRRGQQTAQLIGARHEEAMATVFLGALRMSLGASTEAIELFDQALESLVHDDPLALALLLLHKGKAVYQLGDPAAGMRLCGESLAVCERHDEHWHRAEALWELANLCLYEGQTDEAAVRALESLRLNREFRNPVGIARCIETLAWIAEARAEHARAARLLGSTDALWRTTDALFDPQSVRHHERCRDQAVRALGERAFRAQFEAGVRAPVAESIAFALGEVPASSAESADSENVRLTPREWEIADLLAHGASNRDIASKLVISPRTVEGHVVNILGKLGFSSRVQVAVWIAEHGAARHSL
ncbi:ATP-binding protein [Nocardia sp. NPDC052278]|uniref:ATP-binding protein n=1 Tax=Nocardia sp. NPDC052278 TaxID=3364328 RepID=UPI0037C840B2